MNSQALPESIPQTPPDFQAMQPAVQAQLLALNKHFYATVGEEFDRTRQSLPAGMVALAEMIYQPRPLRILDVGCGNGRFARALAQVGGVGQYTGIDADAQLLALARAQTAALADWTPAFRPADLAGEWLHIVADRAPFDAVICLAVLHHFPGYALRAQIVQALAGLLAPGGVLAISTWQFLGFDRFTAKLAPWAEISLRPEQVEPGDALLPWNQGAHALRYVHELDLAEVKQLAAQAGLTVAETFRADGKEGNLNLYTLLSKQEA